MSMSILSQVHKEVMKKFLLFKFKLTVHISILKEHFVINKEIELNLERQAIMMETGFCSECL